MSRQVDVKSLVSHIVRGDGLDKCRICMGDTSQGQVHLTDTVMMDGDKAVTLSELLEVITGVEVETDEALPSAICLTCSFSAFEAADFRTLVQRTEHKWTNMVELIQHVPKHEYAQTSDKILAVVSENYINITDEYTKSSANPCVKKPKLLTTKRLGKTKDCHCPTCGKKFQYASLLHRHLKESADLIRACHICAKIMSRNVLVKHLKEEHDTKPFACKKCPAIFINAKPFYDHMVKDHTHIKPGTPRCVDCNRSFKSSHAFYAHQSVHLSRSCPNCDKSFQNQMCYSYHVSICCNLNVKTLDKHKLTVSLQNKENKIVKMGKRGSTNNKCVCDYCNKTFSAKKFVSAHIQIVHTTNTHRACTYCGKIFASANMYNHLKSHENPSFKCEQCGTVLKSKLGFKQHLRLHSGERPYKCNHCGEAFSASSRRSEHIRNKHFKSEIVLKHVCALCPAKFRLPSKLKLHLRKAHKDSKGSGGHECTECHEKFTSCRSLQTHSRNHINPNIDSNKDEIVVK